MNQTKKAVPFLWSLRIRRVTAINRARFSLIPTSRHRTKRRAVKLNRKWRINVSRKKTLCRISRKDPFAASSNTITPICMSSWRSKETRETLGVNSSGEHPTSGRRSAKKKSRSTTKWQEWTVAGTKRRWATSRKPTLRSMKPFWRSPRRSSWIRKRRS